MFKKLLLLSALIIAPCSNLIGGDLNFTQSIQSEYLLTNSDQKLQTLYPETFIGCENIHASIISVLRRIETTPLHELTQEDLKTYTRFQRSIAKGFLETIKDGIIDRTEEFNSIHNSIFDEIENIYKEDLKDLPNIRHILDFQKALHVRLLCLASQFPLNEESLSFASFVPGTEFLFASLEVAPMVAGVKNALAWEHSSNAILANVHILKERTIYPFKMDFYPRSSICNPNTIRDIKNQLHKQGFHSNITLPAIFDKNSKTDGKIGITLLFKMILRNMHLSPFIKDKHYSAHGVGMEPVAAFFHDTVHCELDNREDHIMQAILNLLEKARDANQNPNNKDIQTQATTMMLERYNALHNLLWEYVEAKEQKAINTLTAARDLAPENPLNQERKTAEMKARREYNSGIVPLFYIFHELYNMNTSVLEATSFENALSLLCKMQKKSETEEFDPLKTYFNPLSNLTDDQIKEKFKSTTLQCLSIFPITESGKEIPITIGDYLHNIEWDKIEIERKPTHIRIKGETRQGQPFKHDIETTHYMINSAKDINALLKVVGLGVNESVLKEDMESVKTWYDEVNQRMATLMSQLPADILEHISEDKKHAYNILIQNQESEWNKLVPSIIPNPIIETSSATK